MFNVIIPLSNNILYTIHFHYEKLKTKIQTVTQKERHKSPVLQVLKEYMQSDTIFSQYLVKALQLLNCGWLCLK